MNLYIAGIAALGCLFILSFFKFIYLLLIIFNFAVQFSLQTDMTRRQLEYEARQIRAAMEEQLGTCQDMEKRAQVRRDGTQRPIFT